MSATNDFVPFATGTGANVPTQSSYLANPALSGGQQPGIASSAINNKALRQGTYMASCLAQFLANITGNNVLDDGVQSEVLATMAAAFKKPPTTQKFLSGSGMYTLPSGPSPIYIRVRMAGGGGGGGNTGATAGGNTTFGSNLTANGGGAGSLNGGAGGTAVILSGTGLAISGGSGNAAGDPYVGSDALPGGMGGSNSLGGAGGGGAGGTGGSSTGSNAAANTGAGGGGYGSTAAGALAYGGGGAGGYIDIIIPSPSATYSYSVGAGGTAGSGSGSGAAGIIIVEEFYG